MIDHMISDTERIIAESEAKAKAKKEMASHGPVVHNDGPVVHHEIIGGGANDTIDGGEGGEAEDVEAGHQPALANGGTFHLPHLTHSWISFSNSTVISLFFCDDFTQIRSQSECWLKLLLYAIESS